MNTFEHFQLELRLQTLCNDCRSFDKQNQWCNTHQDHCTETDRPVCNSCFDPKESTFNLYQEFFTKLIWTVLFISVGCGLILAVLAGGFENPLLLALGIAITLVGVIFSIVIVLWKNWIIRAFCSSLKMCQVNQF